MPSVFPDDQLEGICTLYKHILDLFVLDVLAASAYLLKVQLSFSYCTRSDSHNTHLVSLWRNIFLLRSRKSGMAAHRATQIFCNTKRNLPSIMTHLIVTFSWEPLQKLIEQVWPLLEDHESLKYAFPETTHP